MQYPLELRFKILSLSQQISVVDANKNPVMHVKQKMFRFKERVEVFSDSTLSRKAV
jgi:uncharacterized protein YxjI